VTRVKN